MQRTRSVPFLRHVGLGVLLAAALAACSKGAQDQAQKKQMPPAPVKVAAAVKKDVPLRLNVTGSVEAYATVSITSQISGQIEKIHFKEGEQVAKGSLLATIDPRPFKTAVAQAEAALARDTVQLNNARRDAERNESLARDGVVPRQQADQASAAADSLAATVAADKASLENARLQLAYCYIHSPIDGQTGSVQLDEGNLIKANDKTMVTIFQVKPVYVSFALPQAQLAAVRENMAQGRLKVTATPEGVRGAEGSLVFIDNGIDPATGTIRMKASFANGGGRLVPGQFVNVSLTLTTEKDALTIPSHAVMNGQKGEYVFVVKNGMAEMRPVTVRRSFGGDALIENGLAEGDTVVTDGQIQVIPGGPVKPAESGEKGKEESR